MWEQYMLRLIIDFVVDGPCLLIQMKPLVQLELA